MLVDSLNPLDFTEKNQRFRDYIHALEQERGKIQVFQRELPLCLELVTQAIAVCRLQLSGTESNCNVNDVRYSSSSELPVLEEFIPLKKVSSGEGEEESQKPDDDMNSKKSDWLSSVQLWNQAPDPPAKLENIKGVKIENESGGAFQPFKKEMSYGTATTAPAAQVRPASATSTAETSGGNKEEEKEGRSQRKARRTWSPELHRRFLQALEQFGGPDVATPKLIREFMKVDGLTNDEVKSHLQKYRLHVRRPSPSFQSTTINSPRTSQYVVVGGVWASSEYAEVAAITTSGEASGSIGVYTPIASLSPLFRSEKHHMGVLNFNEMGEGRVESHSPAAAASSSSS